jgi:hypothetical protein
MSSQTAFRSLVAALASLSLVACLDQPVDPDGPGELIGLFAVAAKLDTNTCGAGALGAPTNWTFDIRLSREGELIYWDKNGDVVTGQLSADKRTFSFDTTVALNMRDANSDPFLPPCTVERRDRSDGQIAEGDTSFSGTLSYGFTPTVGSDCTDLVFGEAPVFIAIPCAMTYELTATRSDAP